MPELPEVETIVRDLQRSDIIGKSIKKVVVFWPRSIGEPKVADFCSQLINETIVDITRRGKFIVFTLSRQTLLVHLRMTGKFSLSEGRSSISSHERVRLGLSDGRWLHYEDQRKFGKWYLISHLEARLGELGLEPLSTDFSYQAFRTLLQKSSQQIKPFLLNQKHIVGLGNIYVDESLWEAKIHPQKKANTLSESKIKALYAAIPMVLKKGIENMGTSLGSKQANYFSVSGRRGNHQSHLKVFRRDGRPCPRCQTKIIKIFVAQRGTHLCPNCQNL